MDGAEMMWLLSLSARAALLLAASWLGAVLLRRSTAAARHHIWALGVAGALLLPLLCWALPSLPLPLSVKTPAIGAGRSIIATAVLVTAGRTTASAGAAAPTWPTWLALGWAAGVLLVSLRFLRGYLAARRLSRAAAPAHAEAWLSARDEAAAALGIAADVGLGRIEAIRSPMTIGVRHPRVLLPAAADGWSAQRLRAVLMHELGHVRRHDTRIQLGAQLLCAVYWWNPLAWLAAARLRREREHACDDLVLAAGIRPSSYAADLLDVARGLSPDKTAQAGAICMVDPSGTGTRLRRILDATTPRRPPGARFRLVACGATLACAVTLACASAPMASPAAAGPVAATAAVAPRAKHGMLQLGDPSVNGGDPEDSFRPPALAEECSLDLSAVAREVEHHLGDLKQCYERRLLVHPELAGTVVMHWSIASTGAVEEQCVTEDTVGDPEIIACVNQLVHDGNFPAPHDGPVDVSFPFVFTAVP